MKIPCFYSGFACFFRITDLYFFNCKKVFLTERASKMNFIHKLFVVIGVSSFFVVLLQHLDTNVVENAAGCLLNLLCYERNVLAGTDSTDALHAHSLHEQITSDEVSWSALIGLVLQNDGDDPRKLELPGRILLLCLGMGARLPVTQLRKKQVRDLLPSLCIDSTMKERLLELCQPRDQ